MYCCVFFRGVGWFHVGDCIPIKLPLWDGSQEEGDFPCMSAEKYIGRYAFRRKRIKHFEDCISLDFGDNFHPQDLDFPGIRMVASCLDYEKRQGGHGSIMLPILKNTQ